MIDVRYTLGEKTICFSDYDNWDDLQADLAEITGVDLNGEKADEYDKEFIRELYIIPSYRDEYESEKYIDLYSYSTEDNYNLVVNCNAIFDSIDDVEIPILAWISYEDDIPDQNTIENMANNYFGECSSGDEAALNYLLEVRDMSRDEIDFVSSFYPNFLDVVAQSVFDEYDGFYFYNEEW